MIFTSNGSNDLKLGVGSIFIFRVFPISEGILSELFLYAILKVIYCGTNELQSFTRRDKLTANENVYSGAKQLTANKNKTHSLVLKSYRMFFINWSPHFQCKSCTAYKELSYIAKFLKKVALLDFLFLILVQKIRRNNKKNNAV